MYNWRGKLIVQSHGIYGEHNHIVSNVAIHTVSCCWGEQGDIPSVPHSRAEPSSTAETSQDDGLPSPCTQTSGSTHHDSRITVVQLGFSWLQCFTVLLHQGRNDCHRSLVLR